MNTVRPPAVAGAFYPADRHTLETLVDGLIPAADSALEAPKAIIVPHAGYVYSGPIAAAVYGRIRAARERIERVVLLGPAHRVGFHGLALSSADSFLTPLGLIPLDPTAKSVLQKFSYVREFDAAHAQEHSLEVQLPFLQRVLDHFSLLPIVVGQADPADVGAVLAEVWGGPETLIVISSDLSHYHDYETARRRDAKTSEAIERLAPERIDFEDACGRLPVAGLLLEAKRRGLHCTTVDLRNSGDTAGSKDRVVGYGGYVFQ